MDEPETDQQCLDGAWDAGYLAGRRAAMTEAINEVRRVLVVSLAIGVITLLVVVLVWLNVRPG